MRAPVLLALAAACSSRDPRAPAAAPPAAAPPAAAPPAAAPPALTLITADEPGPRLALTVTVTDPRGAPLVADVHVYQADARGHYTPDAPMDEPHARLAGRITTDAAGRFVLHTIRPGHYPQAVTLDGVARHIPAHVHVDVRADGHRERRVQVVFADDPELAEPYWQAWARDLHQPIVPLTATAATFTGAVTLALD